MAERCRWFPAINLYQILAEFLYHPLRFEQEISKTKITHLPAPKSLHRFEVKRLKRLAEFVLMGQSYQRTNTVVFLINYHFVWCPTRRRKVLTGPVEKDLCKLLTAKAADLDC